MKGDLVIKRLKALILLNIPTRQKRIKLDYLEYTSLSELHEPVEKLKERIFFVEIEDQGYS